MSKFKLAALLLCVLVFACGLFFFKDAILKTYHSTIQDFQKSDLGNLVQQVKQEILSPTPLNVGGTANNSVLLASKVIIETNLARKENGDLPALKENAKLDAAAKAKANDMFKNQYFEHVSQSGVDPGTLAKSYGYDYIVEGENLILGNFSTEKEVVQDWMNSPGHRANILNVRYVDIGVAMVKGIYKGQTAWIGVQEFGLPLSTCNQPNEALKTQIQANQDTLNQEVSQINAKRAEINSTDPRSSQYNQLVDEYNAMVTQYNSLNDTTKQLIAQFNGEVNVFNKCVAGT